jgi:hypothetical protein
MGAPTRSHFQRDALVLVLVVVLVVGGLALWRARQDECDEWQAEYLDLSAQTNGGSGGVFSFINQGPLDALEERKPPGCATP